MKMNKFGALAMTAMLGTSVLTGCGGESTSANAAQGSDTTVSTGDKAKATETKDAGAVETQKVELKIWVPEEEVTITDEMVKKFDEAHDEFDITYEIAVVGIDEAPQALSTDADTAADAGAGHRSCGRYGA